MEHPSPPQVSPSASDAPSGRAGHAPGTRDWLIATLGGLGLWASSFLVLYGGLSLGCEALWHERSLLGTTQLRLVLAAAWLAHLLAIAALWWWFRRWPRSRMLPTLARTLAAVAFVATAWTGWPVLVLQPCAGQAVAGLVEETEIPCSRS